MKGRSGRASGGKTPESPSSGVKAWEQDLATKPTERTPGAKVNAEAKERKRGGKIKGDMPKKDAGRMPRKSGGRTGSNFNPMSSAHAGTPARGHTANAAKD